MTSQIRNTFIQAYLDLNKTLVKTLLIKSTYGIYAINKELTLQYGESAVDRYNPSSWKYYKNLAGEYHHTDTPMNVISLDTRQEILFSVENLKQHAATAEGYQYGTRFYHALIAQFPTQEFLIHGILNPCDKAKAIAAENGTILSYPPALVDENETTLIMELESFIKLYQARWDVSAFALTDPYYGTVQRALLALQLLPKLLNLRLKRCKTDEVHTFHLQQYLASHHKLDRWLPYLTREQALWLYRNVGYLERNSGKVDNFQTLLKNLLDKRGIPVAEYSIRQFASFDNNGYPILQARRRQVGAVLPASQESHIDMDLFFEKEQKTAYGNPRYFELSKKRMTHALAVSPSSVIKTKDLESVMVDLTDSIPDPLPDVMLRQWVAMTHQGLYNVVIDFQDPKTTETFSLLSWDAIVYMLYLTCRMENLPFSFIPATANVKFRLHPKPNVSELTRLIEPGLEALIPIAEDLVMKQPELSDCFSVDSFNKLATKIYTECTRQWYLLSGTDDLYARGVLEKMILKLYGSSLRDFSKGEEAEVWRARNNLPVYDRSYTEAQELIKEIFERATGYRIDETKKLRNIQKALIELFETLSSYSIQFMTEINDSRLLMTNGSSLRLGNISEYPKDKTRVRIGMQVLDLQSFVQDENYVHSQLDESILAVQQHIFDDIRLDQAADLDISTSANTPMVSNHLATSFQVTYQIPDPVTNELVTYPHLSLDELLTQDQLKALKFVGE